MSERLKKLESYFYVSVKGDYGEMIRAMTDKWGKAALDRDFHIERGDEDCTEDELAMTIKTLDELTDTLQCFAELDTTLISGIKNEFINATSYLYNKKHLINIYNTDEAYVNNDGSIANDKLQKDLVDRIDNAVNVLRGIGK